MRKLKHDEIPRADPSAIDSLPRHPVRVIVEDVRSIHNVGSIFRTSDAAAIQSIYLTGYTGTPDHPALHRTALGAQDTVPWEKRPEALPLLRELKEEGFTIAALEITDRPTAIEDLEVADFPLCLIVGNELHGISEHVLQASDIAIEIPQFGAKQSLNVSVAYGIAVFDLIRRYRKLHPDGEG